MSDVETKVVPLRKGIKVGEERHTEAEIREMFVDDVLQANEMTLLQVGETQIPVNPGPSLVSARLMALRVVRIGTMHNPGILHIRKLSNDDFGRLDQALEAMDRAHAAWKPAAPDAKDASAGRS
jgi:phage FluMu protein gp41